MALDALRYPLTALIETSPWYETLIVHDDEYWIAWNLERVRLWRDRTLARYAEGKIPDHALDEALALIAESEVLYTRQLAELGPAQ